LTVLCIVLSHRQGTDLVVQSAELECLDDADLLAPHSADALLRRNPLQVTVQRGHRQKF